MPTKLEDDPVSRRPPGRTEGESQTAPDMESTNNGGSSALFGPFQYDWNNLDNFEAMPNSTDQPSRSRRSGMANYNSADTPPPHLGHSESSSDPFDLLPPVPLDRLRGMGFYPLPNEGPTPDTTATSPTAHDNDESGGPNSILEEYSLSDMLGPMSAEEARAWGWDELQELARRRLNEVYLNRDRRNGPDNHNPANAPQPLPYSGHLEPGSMDFLDRLPLDDLRSLGFSDLRLATESPAHDAEATRTDNSSPRPQASTRWNWADDHNSVNPPQCPPYPGQSELEAREQTGNNVTTPGFDLGSLDYDEVINNSSPHPQSSQIRWNTADEHHSANPPPSPNSGHAEPEAREQTGNGRTMSGIDLGSFDFDDYEVFDNTSPRPQAEEDNTTSMGDLSGEIERVHLR